MFTFKEALKKCKSDQKIIFGTRTEKFHIISSDDRDFNTRFALTKCEAKKLGETMSALKSVGC